MSLQPLKQINFFFLQNGDVYFLKIGRTGKSNLRLADRIDQIKEETNETLQLDISLLWVFCAFFFLSGDELNRNIIGLLKACRGVFGI